MNLKIKYSLLISVTILTLQNSNAQTQVQREAIIETYNIDLLNNLYLDFHSEYISKYNQGVEYLTIQNLPLSGVDSDGNSFSLKKYDAEINNVLYYQSFNNTSTKSSIQTARVQSLHNGSAIGHNIKGQNMILGIWDGGQPLATHQNLGVLRVINKDGQFTTGNNAGAIQNGINHATHVSGTMIGSGNNQIFAKGIASEGVIWANTWDDDLAEMTDEAAQGLLVSNHSYGINNRSYVNLPGYFGKYTDLSKGVDILTYNAEFYLPSFAAGNDRAGIYVGGNLVLLNEAKGGYDLLTHEMVAKNPIVVAAVAGITSYVLEPNGTNNVEMSSFSQWGPTDDFRIKPDISAKGVNVYSSTGTGNTNYSILNGTSMATPAVTGVFSLWQQIHNKYWPTANNNSGFMKAASLKALMTHTASEAGDAPGPDPKFGWGLINAEEGAKVLKKAYENKIIFKELKIIDYQQHKFLVTIDGSEPLIATIAWTDQASEAVQISESLIPLLVNDLDLRIKKIGSNETFYPWKLNKSWSNIYSFKGDNDVDPIEKIECFNFDNQITPAGVYEIIITHKNILFNGSQNFSLIVSGGILNYNQTVNNEEFKEEEIILFPNPAKEEFYISNSNYDKIDFFDLTGKKIILDAIIENNFIKFNISTLESGYYNIILYKNNQRITKKIIKKYFINLKLEKELYI